MKNDVMTLIPRVVLALAIVWSACEQTPPAASTSAVQSSAPPSKSGPSEGDERSTDNPLASCARVAPSRVSGIGHCVTLEMRDMTLTSGEADGEVRGHVEITNRCETAIAVLIAPIDTRVDTTGEITRAYEEFSSSAYARLTLRPGGTETGPSMVDRGFPVKGLPAYSVVPRGDHRRFTIGGRSDRLGGLQPDIKYYFTLCTFVAPSALRQASESEPDYSDAIDIGSSVAVFNASVAKPCSIRLRDAAGLLCSGDVVASVTAQTSDSAKPSNP